MKTKKILFATSEAYPFVKTGGLADVSYALAKEANLHMDIDTILPLYKNIDRDLYNITKDYDFILELNGNSYDIDIFRATFEDRNYLFIYESQLCETDILYGENDAIRFAIFSKSVVEVAKKYGYRALHLNDWMGALASLWVKEQNLDIKTLFTIHNLAYQGQFNYDTLYAIGLDDRYGTSEELEFYGGINYLKAGIKYSDFITTVSVNYAKEILEPSNGCGLDGLLSFYSGKLSGILNGIDRELYSPKTSPFLSKNYRIHSGKIVQKRELFRELPLKVATKPLFVFIGRLVEQKGVDALLDALPQMLKEDINILVIGDGGYSRELSNIKADNFYFYNGFREDLSHRAYAAADFLLMPSVYEPCGLNQMIALSFGAIPIVTKVGGLADSVKKIESFDETKNIGYGIVLNSYDSNSIVKGVKKAIKLFAEKEKIEQIANHNMKLDLSWSESVKKYLTIYKKLLK